MWLTKAADFIDRGLSPCTVVVGKIGSSIIVLMMLVMVSDVVGRRLFHQAILGVYETSQVMLVIVAFFTMGYVERSRSHIIIDLVVNKFRQRAQDAVCAFMYLLFLGTSCVLAWRLTLDAMGEQRAGSIISTTLAVPTSLFIFAAAFGTALLSLMVLVHLLLFLAGAVKK